MNSNKTWRVVTGSRERKFLDTIPLRDNERIIQALDELVVDPWHGDVQKLGGEKSTWRRRVGDYRVIFKILIGVRQRAIENDKKDGHQSL